MVVQDNSQRQPPESVDAIRQWTIDHDVRHGETAAGHHEVHFQQKDALDAALEALNKRLEGMNEFRASLDDANQKSVSRDVLDALLNPLMERVRFLENELSVAKGRAATQAVALGIFLTIVVILVNVGIALSK